MGLQASQVSTTQPNFDDVVLTSEEVSEALYFARAKKWGIEFDKKAVEEKRASYESTMRPWTKSEMLEVFNASANKIVVEKGKDAFLIDSSNEAVISDLCDYFTGTSNKLAGNRGILMMGGVGNGKTTIMEAFSKNKIACFKKIEAAEMVHYVKMKGAESWKIFLSGSYSPGLKENFHQRYCGWLIDDLGTEEVINDFGNRLDIIANIVFAIEKDRRKYAGMFHFTTNLGAKELQERYGARITSRLGELCNQVVLPGDDRRG